VSSATFVHLYPDCSRALNNIRNQISNSALIVVDFIDPMHYTPSKILFDHAYVASYSREKLNLLFKGSDYNVISTTEYVIGIGDIGGIIGEVFGLMVIARPQK
jgi:hypothetical protein